MMGYGSLSASAKSLALKEWLENWQWPRLQVTATYYSSDSDTNIQNVATAPVSSSIIVALVLH